ncbi:MAG TPA: hypothetical protein V6C95_15975 [Coleofasciculaceae cyanobacterium]
MTASCLKQFLLTPVLISSSIFFTATLPLMVLGNQPIQVQLQEESVFSGKVKDLATPYLVLAALVSVGGGIAAIALAGWRQSYCQSHQIQVQFSDLQQELATQEAQLTELKLSESRLKATGLDVFLTNDSSSPIPVHSEQTADKVISEVSPNSELIPNSNTASCAFVVMETASPIAQPIESIPHSLATATASLPASHIFQGFTLLKVESHLLGSTTTETTASSVQVSQMQQQLKDLITQLEGLQRTAPLTPQLTVSTPESATEGVNSKLYHLELHPSWKKQVS